MASILGPKYLRVRVPRTSDGITLVYDDQGKILYDETELPMTALRHLERRNTKLAKMHKAIITVIDEQAQPDQAAVSKLVKGVGAVALTKEQQKQALKDKLAKLEEGEENKETKKAGKKQPAEELV